MDDFPVNSESEKLIHSKVGNQYGVVQTKDNKEFRKITGWRVTWEKRRNFLGFWILGLCIDFTYVLMLSAAYDILDELQEHKNTTKSHKDESNSCKPIFNNVTNTTSYTPRQCLPQGTYQILMADILPTLVVKFTIPFFMHIIPYWIRMSLVVVIMLSSLITVALSNGISLVLLGVGLTSFSAGLAEISMFAYCALYDKSAIAAFSAGTGASGISAATYYLIFSSFLSPKTTLLIPLFIPIVLGFRIKMSLVVVIMLSSLITVALSNNISLVLLGVGFWGINFISLCFFFILGTPNNIPQPEVPSSSDSNSDNVEKERHQSCLAKVKKQASHVFEQIHVIPHLFVHYMIWLFLVYSAEYLINQSLFESLYYPNTHIKGYCLNQNTQYVWYQFAYQTGALLSRTSVVFFRIKFYYVLAFLQVCNFAVLFNEVVFQFIPFFWITLFIILYEGMLGGAVFGNSFYYISKKVHPKYREFAMGVTSMADCSGISTAAISSMFVHKYICSLGY